MHTSLLKTLTADPQLATVRQHFDKHGTAMINAANLIGGAAAARKVLRLLSDLREAASLDRPVKRRLVALHRFFALDPYGTSEEEDLDLSSVLDPSSREVEEICLLSDQLLELLEKIGALAEEKDACNETLSLHWAA